MNLELLGVIVVAFVLFIFILLTYTRTKKKLSKVLDELKFLKKEKEYYTEAMLLLSKEYTIIYANQSAKNLFSLDKNNDIPTSTKKVKLQINSTTRGNFFEILEEHTSSSNESLTLENVHLIISGHEYKVNIFMDKSALNVNNTMTCIIDILPENNAPTGNSDKIGAKDFLTGLPSQFLALSDINALVVDNKKKSDCFTILLMGIDHFSDIQTTLGLGYTNTILKRMADYFSKNLDNNMRIYRMESDKFMFIIDTLAEEQLAKDVAKNLIVEVENVFRDNNNIHLTTSVGIVFYPESGENATKLTDNVYIALDKAQRKSKSNIEIFNSEDQAVHIDDIQMNEEIRKGLIRNEFLLYYQPLFDIDGEMMVGAEALLRWQHPTMGLISADKFLHVAEKTGLIIDLGEYVFKEAIEQRQRCESWVKDDFKITINMSLKEMKVEQLIPRLEMLFDTHKVATHMINLDISEDAAMENIDKTANDFKLFKDLGLSLSLEHFGAGYSSLKYLNLLPIDTIKIDRSLIFDLTLNIKHQTTVKAIIDLAHTLGYKVVAEGVETSQESSILKGLQCDFAQGYLYSRPLPYNDFEALLQ